jgi:hypothetical protein
MRRVALVVVALGLLQLAAGFLGVVLSDTLKCNVIEGAGRCLLWGGDITGLVQTLWVAGFGGFLFYMFPAALVLAGWAVAEIVNALASP